MVALVPVAGPVPPPNIVVTPDERASSICWGQMKWTWVSIPPAVRIKPSPATTSVDAPTTISGSTPAIRWGFPDLPTPAIDPSLTPTSALTTPQ